MGKIDVISGFLGAGKTTLIKKLLKDRNEKENVVIIENEFGDVGIDGTFLQEAGIKIREINSGCICCSLVGDFKEALHKVVDEYHPDRLVIEPSGVGKLSDVIGAITASEIDYELNILACVVDVNKAKMYNKNFKEFFQDQIEAARTVVLSRTQNASDEKIEEVVHMLKELNEDATYVIAPWEEVTSAQLREVMEVQQDHEEEHHHEHEGCCCGHDHEHEEGECCGHHHEHEEGCCCGHDHEHEEDECCGHHHEHEEGCCCGHDHEHEEGECCGHHHHHGHHHADDMFVTVAFDTVHAYSKEELKEMLESLDENILRAKGMVKGKEGWLFFDYVPEEIDIREGSTQPVGKIVLIGTSIDEAQMKEVFKV